jgi:hypothetical protein
MFLGIKNNIRHAGLLPTGELPRMKRFVALGADKMRWMNGLLRNGTSVRTANNMAFKRQMTPANLCHCAKDQI